MDWTKNLRCLHCNARIEYCGCSAEFFGSGHDEDHCVCKDCKSNLSKKVG